MEALYKKLYKKYKELKNKEESEFDKLNKDQEEKFLNFAAAADEMIQYLKSETDKLLGQADELKSELASVRASSDEQKRLLMEENQKNEVLSEEISRLRKVEHDECSHCNEIERRVENTHDTPGEETPGESVRRSTRKRKTPGESVRRSTRKRKFGYTAEGPVVPYVNVEVDRQAGQHVSIQQPACCKRKIGSSVSDAADSSSLSCMFQHLVELVLGMQVSPLTQSNEPCILARHQSSGYSFSLTWITTSNGGIELLYRVLSLGTFERVAPEWMKETLMFSTSMCSVFFDKVSGVLKS